MRTKWTAAAVTGVMIVLVGCSKEQEKEAEPVVPVRVAEARRESIERVLTAQGTLRALDQSAIVPKISAPVRTFHVNRGDHVRKGQLLAVLENLDLSAAVTDAKGAYDQAAASYHNVTAATLPDEVVKAQADVQASKQALEAARKLLESRQQLLREGALARRQVDEAAVAFAQARSQYETADKHLQSFETVGRHEEAKSAAGQLESAKGKYEGAQAQLSYSEIHSPISGVIADRPLFPGEMASAGTPLLTVMDISSVIARVNIPDAEAAHVKVGQAATVTANDSSVETNGTVTVVSPAFDPQSTTVEIWVQAKNPGERLRPGQTVHVAIDTGRIPDAVVIPSEALFPGQAGGATVLVIGPDSVAHEHAVRTGAQGAGKVQVVSGVAPGERVVIAGGMGLRDGTKVRVETGQAAEKADGHE